MVNSDCTISWNATEHFIRGPVSTLEFGARPIRKWKEEPPADPAISALPEGIYIARHTLIRDEQSLLGSFHVLINRKTPLAFRIKGKSLVDSTVLIELEDTHVSRLAAMHPCESS